jgi:peptidoglycan/xylan/chitin deacetylase (PgdA/CDA1 family)
MSTIKQRVAARKYYRDNWARSLWYSARRRARKFGVPFEITVNDVKIPEVCPVLGIPLQVNSKPSDTSASIDRVHPQLGYTKDNIIVVSHKANTMKSNATIEELERLVEFYKKL